MNMPMNAIGIHCACLEILGNQRVIHQRLQQVDERCLNGCCGSHTDNRNEADQLVRCYVSPQAAIDDLDLGTNGFIHVTQPDR